MPDDTRISTELPADLRIAQMAEQAENAAALLKALSHQDRLMILCHLSGGAKSVSELEALIGARQATVSQHLARLRRDGLVSASREGKTIIYAINGQAAQRIVETLYDVYCGR